MTASRPALPPSAELAALRAIVFDMDGTLLDSLDDIAVALDAALVDHGLPVPTRDDVRRWVGSGARRLVEQAVEPARVESVLARFRVHYAAAPVVHTHLYAGLPPVLDRLAASGRKLAVLSNKPHELTVRIAEALLAPWPFEVIAGHREGIPLKPAPEPAHAVAAALGVPAAACAMVGDTTIDVATARASGMLAVAVSWGFRSRDELAAAGPALLLDQPAELLQLAGPQPG